MVEFQLKVFDVDSSERFLFLRKLDKSDAQEIQRKTQEKFTSFFVPSKEENFPIIQMQLWEIEGNGNQHRSLLEETYLEYDVKEELVMFIEQEI